jgi:hypothetical protein
VALKMMHMMMIVITFRRLKKKDKQSTNRVQSNTTMF